jgi:hypothetical protein
MMAARIQKNVTREGQASVNLFEKGDAGKVIKWMAKASDGMAPGNHEGSGA